MACKLVKKIDLIRLNFPKGMQSQILARIDRLNEDDALVVKTASLLGVIFLREMLEYVLNNAISHERIQNSISR